MRTHFLFILIALLPLALSAQFLRESDTAYAVIIQDECNSMTFTKTEELPHFKIPVAAFEDSLTTYLQAKGPLPVNKKITMVFVLTKKSQIMNPEVLLDNRSAYTVLFAALDHFSYLWAPAVQNHHEVCSYVKFEVVFLEKKLKVSIKQ